MSNSSTVLTDARPSAEQTIRRVTWIGLFVNLALSAVKFIAGTAGASQAVVADAVHSLSDSTTDLAVIIGSHFWAAPADACHPYGHRRIETFVTIFIGTVLLAAGIGVGWRAVSTMNRPHQGPPGWIALMAAALSLVVKEILYRWTAAAGKRVKSPALAANAWHHRLDAVSSLPALVAVGGAILFPALTFLDQIGAVVISIFIFHAAVKIVWPQFSELMDAGAPAETRKTIRQIAYRNESVRQVHRLRTRYLSASLQVDLHIVVDGNLTVREGHNIAEAVKEAILRDGPDVVDVVVHVEPPEAALPDDQN